MGSGKIVLGSVFRKRVKDLRLSVPEVWGKGVSVALKRDDGFSGERLWKRVERPSALQCHTRVSERRNQESSLCF